MVEFTNTVVLNKESMFKRIALALTTLLLSLTSLIPVAAGAVGTNLIANPSVETVAGTSPTNWNQGQWGTNTTTFAYQNSGKTGAKSLSINMTKYTSGDAKWYFTDVPVKANTKYNYSEFYKSSVATEIDVRYTDTSNNLTYTYLSAPPASTSTWSQTTASFTTPANVKSLTIFHILNKIGTLQTDDFTLTESNGTVITPPTSPTVSVSSPTDNATVSGIQTITASATDAIGIKNVQFMLDGVNFGAADTNSPYSVSWDTAKVTNGTHTLSAIATNTSGLTATASVVTTNVQNSVATPPAVTSNLIPNPSLETGNGTTPVNWLSSSWGTNTSKFSYPASGHTGSHSVRVDTTAYTDGASNWYYDNVPVTAGKTYKYENWYQSNVDTEVDAEVTMNDGSKQYFWVGTVPANTAWTKFSATFTAPSGAKSMALYQILAKKGYIVSDDYSLFEYTPAALNRALVSITFDDGWANQYTNALPQLQKNGLPATFYITSGVLTEQPEYMTTTRVKNLYKAGMEIGSHTVHHCDLTGSQNDDDPINCKAPIPIGDKEVQNEMGNSKATLESLIGAPVTNFAYPYGAYNANTITIGQQYYRSQRSVNRGFNTKDNFDITQLKIYEVDNNITQAQVQAWINQAIAEKSWLILVYHEVAAQPIDSGNAQYTTHPTDFTAEMNYIKNSGIAAVTVNQALNEILPQL